MSLDRAIGAFLHRAGPRLPTRELLGAWMTAGFDRERCSRELERILDQRSVPSGLFDVDEVRKGGRVATPKLLYEIWQEAPWILALARPGDGGWRRIARPFPSERVPEAARFFRRLRTDPASLQPAADALLPDLPPLAGPPPASWRRPTRPGLYRREHASVLVRSRTSSLLLDPLALAVGHFPPILSEAPLEAPGERIDAVAITHTHADHYHLPSVLYHVEPETPVIVPQVPVVNILTTESPAASLASAGQHVLSPAWGETLHIGDIELEVLPFLGEQPTRDSPGPAAELRNWGNCYHVTTPDFTALFLVDSGADPAGDMVDVIAEVTARRGPVDVVLSCLQPFPSPFSPGVSTDFLTLPFDRLRELYGLLKRQRLPSATGGVIGAVRACRAASARLYLTYANGFSGVGSPGRLDWGADELEREALDRVESLLGERGISTQVVDWCSNDALCFTEGVGQLEQGSHTAR